MSSIFNQDLAVLMLGFGGPNSFEEVRPFIETVVRGRNVPPQRIDTVVEQYRQIGGKSPFNELTFDQAIALEDQLDSHGLGVPVYVGMLFASPTIAETFQRITQDGITRLIAVVMAPHRTEASFSKYEQAVNETVNRVGTTSGASFQIEYIPSWFSEPLFIEAISARVAETLKELDSQLHERTALIFTAHSIPEEMDRTSGYAKQVKATAELVSGQIKSSFGIKDWSVAFQSRSGNPKEKWLEPDPQAALCAAKQSGKEAAVVVPIGFVCEHVEVLYDLDVLAASQAQEIGIKMVRAATVGSHPSFIKLLANLVKSKAESFYAKPERN